MTRSDFGLPSRKVALSHDRHFKTTALVDTSQDGAKAQTSRAAPPAKSRLHQLSQRRNPPCFGSYPTILSRQSSRLHILQSAMRTITTAGTSSNTSTARVSVSAEARRPATGKAIRHGRTRNRWRRQRQAQRCGAQSHSVGVLQEKARSRDDEAEDGGDGQQRQ